MKAVNLGEETRKEAFVKHVIDYCGWWKTSLNGRGLAIFAFELKIKNESWTFFASANPKSVSTRAILALDSGAVIRYPNTEWGGGGKRWDADLREFLKREVMKEAEQP